MICIGCGADNREDAKFCHGCGSKLQTTCASCSAELRPEAKFCDNCGTRVGAAGEPPNAATGGAATGVANRGAGQPDSFADGRYVTKRLLGEGGKSVILASRIAESASGDQILVSSEILRALQSETDFTFASTGSARLSGLSDEYELFEVGSSSGPGTTPGPSTKLTD